MPVNPSITGQTIPELKSNNISKEPYVLVIQDNLKKGYTSLYRMSREEFFKGSLVDKDITENIFNTANYDLSYQDIIPGTWTGLPDTKKIGLESPDRWIVNYYRSNETGKGGTQIVKSFKGIQFIRNANEDIWGEWNIVSSTPIGAIISGINNIQFNNVNGWLPLNGMAFSKNKYPDLYTLLKGMVQEIEDTFILPDLRGYYLTSVKNSNKVGELLNWLVPDKTDEIGIISGTSTPITLFREHDRRNGKLFQINRKFETFPPYLDESAINLHITGEEVDNLGVGLTDYLKLDFSEGYGEDHVGDTLRPNTFNVSNFYIYGGYPQI